MNEDDRSARTLLRHTLATLAYRGEKALRDVPTDFPEFRVSDDTRTPLAILSHIGDLLDWGLQLAEGRHVWKEATPAGWTQAVDRFFAGLRDLDRYLASDAPLGFSEEKLFQGPIADALTHIGQIALLRRLCGGPVRGENYFKAEIRSGRVSREQAPPAFEFE